MFIPGGVIELGDCDTLNRLEASVKFHNLAYGAKCSENVNEQRFSLNRMGNLMLFNAV